MDREKIFREVEFEHMCEDVKRADETLLQSEIEWVARRVIDKFDATISLTDQINHWINALPPFGLTVGRLIEALQKYPSNAPVVVCPQNKGVPVMGVIPAYTKGALDFVVIEL